MIRRYRHTTQRPDTFRLNTDAQAAQGLVFAGLAPGGLVGGTHYHDSSLYGNHGTLTNMDPATDWVFDPILNRWRVDYDGSNDYANLGLPTLNLFTGYPAITTSCWIKTTQATRGAVLGSYNGSSPFYEFDISRGADASNASKLWCGARRATTGTDLYAYTTDDTVATNGEWHHLAYVMRLVANTVAIYIDGQPEDITYVTQNYGAVGSALTTRYMLVAALNNAGTAANFIAGSLSDVLCHGRELSQAEIQQLADPSNTLLSGLILPPRRMVWPVAVAGGDKTVSIGAALDVTVALEGFPIAVTRTIQITG